MHAHNVRRVLGRRWLWLQRAAIAAIAVQVLFYACSAASAFADTRVDYLQIEREASFSSRRIYAGTSVAKRASELGFKQRGEIVELFVDVAGLELEVDETGTGDRGLLTQRAHVQTFDNLFGDRSRLVLQLLGP